MKITLLNSLTMYSIISGVVTFLFWGQGAEVNNLFIYILISNVHRRTKKN